MWARIIGGLLTNRKVLATILGGLLKNRKALVTGGVIGVPSGLYLLSRGQDDENDEEINQETNQQTSSSPSQTKQQQTTKAKPQTVQQKEDTIPSRQEATSVGAFLPELAKLYQLSSSLALQYEQDAKTYYNIFQQYSEKLEKIIPVVTMTLAKTPLSQITSEDLPEKLYTMFKYYSWDFSANNFSKALQGYYLIKANGGDTSNLTITDLIAASENPALAQGVNENFVMMLNKIAEVYKLNMQGALDQIGKLKDMYAFKLNALKAQADMIGDIIKTIVDEEERRFEQYYKTEYLKVLKQRAQTDAWYKTQTLGLRKEQMQQKLQQNQIPINIQKEK